MVARFTKKDMPDIIGNKKLVGVNEAIATQPRHEWLVDGPNGKKVLERIGDSLAFKNMVFAHDGWLFYPSIVAHIEGPIPTVQVVHEDRVRDARMRHTYVGAAILNLSAIVEIAEWNDLTDTARMMRKKKQKSRIEEWMEATLSLNRIHPTAEKKVKFLRTLQKAVDDIYKMLYEVEGAGMQQGVHVAEAKDFGAVMLVEDDDGKEVMWDN